VLSLGIFFFSSGRKKKHKEKKKTVENKKYAKKGRSLPSSSCFTLSFWAPTFAFLLLPFRFKHFLFASSSSQIEEKKKHKGRKNHREEKKCREGRELTFLLSLLHLG